MKKTPFIFLILFCLLPLLVSCDLLMHSDLTLDYNGYPKKITFPREGDTIAVSGDRPFGNFYIFHGDQSVGDYFLEEDTVTQTFDWLTASSKVKDNTLTLTATPNTTGKKRHLYVEIQFGDEYARIRVEQK